MRQQFIQDAHQKQFDRLGYVRIPFLSAEEVTELREYHAQLSRSDRFNQTNDGISYHFTFLDPNGDYKRKVRKKILDILLPHMNRYLRDYKPLIANYVHKEPGYGEVPVHQNWNFVREDEYVSFSIWVPLQDVSRENGTLEIIPGTQRMHDALRCPTIPWYFQAYTDEIIAEHMTPLNVKAGHAVIFDDALIHYSQPNHSDADRLVIQLIVIPNEAEAVHYYHDQEKPDTVLELVVDHEFFLDFDFYARPTGYLSAKELPYVDRSMDREEFFRKTGRASGVSSVLALGHMVL